MSETWKRSIQFISRKVDSSSLSYKSWLMMVLSSGPEPLCGDSFPNVGSTCHSNDLTLDRSLVSRCQAPSSSEVRYFWWGLQNPSASPKLSRKPYHQSPAPRHTPYHYHDIFIRAAEGHWHHRGVRFWRFCNHWQIQAPRCYHKSISDLGCIEETWICQADGCGCGVWKRSCSYT